MNICLDCGHHFDAGEKVTYKERHGFRDGRCERLTGCPICWGAFEQAASCSKCGGNFLMDKLFPGGLCRECLEEKATVENVMLYVHNCSIEEDFYISHWTGSRMSSVTPRLLSIVKDAWAGYMREHPKDAEKVCKGFVMDDEFGLFHFGEWLEDIRAVRVTTKEPGYEK